MNTPTLKQPYEAPSFTEFIVKLEGIVCASLTVDSNPVTEEEW